MEKEVVHAQHGTFAKRGRFWAVTDAAGQLVCLAVYRKGAIEVLRRLGLGADASGTRSLAVPRNRRLTETTRQKKGRRR